MNLALADKLCLVAGAERGIGRSIALSLAREGARICAIARTADGLAALEPELASAGGGPHATIVADVATAEGAQLAVDACVAALGGIDIVIALDLSGSMRALMDAKDTPEDKLLQKRRLTRLETAKQVILDFVARRKTDRIGVVVFGKSAYILSPPTLDKSLLAGLVEKMELELIDGNGTAIGDALGTSVARLRRSPARTKTVILLTDGDSNSGSIAPEYAAHLAQTQGVRVYTVQIGNGDDVEVQDGNDLFGNPHFVKMHFPVNPELLRKIAHDTGAQAFVANDKRSLEESMHKILDALEKTRFEAQAATMEDLFPFVLLPSVLLFALEALVRLVIVRRFP